MHSACEGVREVEPWQVRPRPIGRTDELHGILVNSEADCVPRAAFTMQFLNRADG